MESKFFWKRIFQKNFGFGEEVFHTGKKRILGSKNVLERKGLGSKKFGRKNLASKIWEVKCIRIQQTRFSY